MTRRIMIRHASVRMGPVRAFTLIEVLIAVLVLALGVLGLAAVFSVGIPQQRIAGDQIQGLNAVRSARAFLLSNRRLNDPTNPLNPLVKQERGWYGLQQRVAQSTQQVFDPDETWSPSGEWILPARNRGDDERWFSLDPVAEGSDKDGGEIVIESPTGLAQLDVRVPVSQRLVPAPYAMEGEPQYVWDFIARRVPSGEVDPTNGRVRPTPRDPIEVAVFVRRVDAGIQIPLKDRADEDDWVRYGKRLRLSDYLTMNAEQVLGDPNGTIPEALRIVPVAMNPDTSEPRRDGRTLSTGATIGEYAAPFGVGVSETDMQYAGVRRGPGGGGSQPLARDRIPLAAASGDPADLNRLRLATQLGHRLLDRFGNVYEVRGVDDELSEELGGRVVIVRPEVPGTIMSPLEFRTPGRDDLDSQAFITTPQTPVAVDVFRVTP